MDPMEKWTGNQDHSADGSTGSIKESTRAFETTFPKRPNALNRITSIGKMDSKYI
jgi:hypothetical protein